MIPERSEAARSAKSVFFQEINDIDIYIEDTDIGYIKLFTIICSRVFENDYEVRKVFPLGNRDAVIRRHRTHVANGRPSVYIIDHDLYMLAGDTVESGEGLFKLPFYCIENVLCDSEAIIEFLDHEEVVRKKDEISDRFNYEAWESLNIDLLFELFVEYALSFKLNPSCPTVSFKVSDVLSSNTGDVCHVKVRDRINEVKESTIAKVGESTYEDFKKEVEMMFTQSGFDKIDVISGKDYLFPLLKLRAKQAVDTKVSNINFKQRLARMCDISKLEKMRNCLIE
ncbi:DUF4435 domain-containing protein [Vreelandella lionensis]|uniref:DUF4435 domain-containing protein n=1 Tax=Vreelandella lionensis TaxID=1144478 RepID=A0ABW8BPU9_9GAMM|tara:strand:- start:1288 stop:2136 length:849 start_codon:yes stop_codon:yes gene_type:complete